MISNIKGIIGKSFTFGTGEKKATITIKEDGTFTLSGPLDLNDQRLQTMFNATEPSDIPNLKLVGEIVDGLYTSATQYTDKKIGEITGGTSGGNVMLLPLPITVADLVDNNKKSFGDLETSKFVDHIVFEVTEDFVLTNGDKYEFAIGSNANAELLMPFHDMTNLTIGGNFFNVGKTLSLETNLVLTIRKSIPPPEPTPPFTQVISNPHSEFIKTSISQDASGNVVTFTITGDGVMAGAISDTTRYPNVTGNYFDLAFNMDLIDGHEYRIVEHNSALIAIKDDDPNVTILEDGSYQREETIVSTASTFYSFLIDNMNSTDDYRHVYVYDPSSDTPDSAIKSYHIDNWIVFNAPEPEPDPIEARSTRAIPIKDKLSFTFTSRSEGTMNVISANNSLYDVYLHGCVSSINPPYEGITEDHTMLYIRTPDLIYGHQYECLVYSQALEYLFGLDPSYQVVLNDGIKTFYSRTRVGVDANGSYLTVMVPIRALNETDPLILILDVTDPADIQNLYTVNVHPDISFMPEVIEEQPFRPAFSNRKIRAAGEEPTVNSGKMIVRILSF